MFSCSEPSQSYVELCYNQRTRETANAVGKLLLLKIKRYIGDVIAHNHVFVKVWDKLLKLRIDDPHV